MPERSPLHTGGCQCGAVRYALYAAPRAGVCHCRMCQKAVGGPFLAWAGVSRADFGWTRGAVATFRSSSAATRGFCAACGTPLLFLYEKRPDHVSVTLGSLDRPAEAAPSLAMGIESRLPWCAGTALDALPTHRTGEVNPPEELSRIVNFQHPDHDTPPGWQPPIA